MADYSDNEDLKDEVSKLNLIVEEINHKIKDMKKSEILFLYETSYNIPNGDPFTGEQRYDEETKRILVSDVRIKRFIRTYLEDIEGEHIYVSDKTGAGKTDSKGVLTWIIENWNSNQRPTSLK